MEQQEHMARSLSAHRRSFIRTTAAAILATLALLVAAGVTVGMLTWGAVEEGWPLWRTVALFVALSGLTILSTYGGLVVVGGFIVLSRDMCEERGLPYAPTRPRERIVSPMSAAIRRSIRPRAPLRPGELAEVRSLDEILETLDESGCLGGLPFMPEMAAYCGHRFQVHRRVDKVWEYAHGTGVRRVRGAVLLRTLRCDGASHGGCQASCELIWKERWLRRPDGAVTAPDRPVLPVDLEAFTRTSVDGEQRYVCQMTQIIHASTAMSQRDPRHYWRDLRCGNVRLTTLAGALGVRTFNGANWRLGGQPWPVIRPTESDSSPNQELGLQPGELVRVKSKHEIEPTLNRSLRNRGLEFGTDMLYCSGGSYRVASRVERIVDERTGSLLEFKTPSILLKGAHANGGTLLTPQNEFFFWREIWLERQPEPPSTENP